MGYAVEGYAHMTILSSNGDHRLDAFKLKSDDVYFIPRAYPHCITNVRKQDVKILIFFDQSIAGDIGYEGSFSVYSRKDFAATFQCDSSQLSNAPFNPQGLLVKRVNPVDI